MAEYEMHLEQAAPRWVAVVRRRADPGSLSKVVPATCGIVWNFIRATSLPHEGLNLAIYKNAAIDLECGVIVKDRFESSGEVVCTTTPSGPVVRTEHYGGYDRLGDAHDAIHQWCRANQHKLTGVRWEIYDHWTEDVEKLHTTVYYQVESNDQTGK